MSTPAAAQVVDVGGLVDAAMATLAAAGVIEDDEPEVIGQ